MSDSRANSDAPTMDSIACENIDRLMNIEMRGHGTLPRGLKWPMYLMAREAAGRSLIAAAAQQFAGPAARVMLVSGAAVPEHMPVGENDGPLGSVVLAKSLTAMGHVVTILTDPMAAAPFRGLLRAMDLNLEVVEIGLHDTALQEQLAEDHEIFCAIERLGGNVNGIIYGATGVSRAPFRANLDRLFQAAREQKKRTIGIGDGGNEIGCGNIHARLSQEMPEFSYRDVTPCGGGVYSTVETDVLVIASSSNMGANALTAGLALLRQDLSLCHTPEDELALAHVGVGLGLIDGGSGKLRPWCDGVPLHANVAMVQLIHTIVAQTLAPASVRKF